MGVRKGEQIVKLPEQEKIELTLKVSKMQIF